MREETPEEQQEEQQGESVEIAEVLNLDIKLYI